MRRGEVAKGSAWALVTGAGSGIGRCFALRLARLGYRLVLVGNDLRKLESVQAELRALDAAEVRVISCDLARAEAARELYERVRAAGIDVDVLINNAGIFSFRDILRTPAERIERVIMLHCLTATQLCRLFARDMAARNGFIDMTGSLLPGIDGFSTRLNVGIVSLMRQCTAYAVRHSHESDRWFGPVLEKGFFDAS